MVFDRLKNANQYFPLGEKITIALQYLSQTDFTNVEPGKYEIDGENIFALVQTYNTKPFGAGKWEAHKKYIDVQYIVSGKEKMGFTETTKVIIMEEYDEEKDCAIYKGEGNFLITDEGHFAIFFPSDVHMPGMAINIPKEVKKVVVKVKTEFAVSSLQSTIEPVERTIDELEPTEEIKPIDEITQTEKTDT
jgi:YhcH/YjgK/YiaL family protein